MPVQAVKKAPVATPTKQKKAESSSDDSSSSSSDDQKNVKTANKANGNKVSSIRI